MIPKPPKNGFTLIEIMVALAIVATALVTLLGSHLMSLNLAHKHKEQSLAAMLGRMKMEETAIIPYDSLVGDSGDFAPEHPEVGWEIEVSDASADDLEEVKITMKTPDGDVVPETIENLKKVKVIIKMPDGHVELVTLVARTVID